MSTCSIFDNCICVLLLECDAFQDDYHRSYYLRPLIAFGVILSLTLLATYEQHYLLVKLAS